MMFGMSAGPPHHPKPPEDGPELQLHPHRRRTTDGRERRLVCLFLRRYVIWFARRRPITPIRPALELLTEVTGTRCRESRHPLCADQRLHCWVTAVISDSGAAQALRLSLGCRLRLWQVLLRSELRTRSDTSDALATIEGVWRRLTRVPADLPAT